MNNLMIASILSMAGLAIFFASVLAFADKKLKVEDNPEVDEINHLLPGVNCGACGFLSCHDFAEHIVTEGANPLLCKVISEEVREKLLEITGSEEVTQCRQIAIVHCAAKTENKKPIADYAGIKTCGAANLIFGAGISCQYGCMGFGDCIQVCPFDAIHMEDGLPKVDIDKCTGCGKCSAICPRQVISIQDKPFENLFYVACKSSDTMMRTRQICSVGCIACGICEKLSQEGYFKIQNNLSYPDYSKQNKPEEVEKLRAKCPTKVIKSVSQLAG
ncbi:MAG: RnfABCDGE type electron transport complex subunit B [Candidatus Omnitrophota bacterium]